MDFTIKKYIELLDALIQAGYSFQTFSEFIKAPKKKSIILRHDVDLKPQNSLMFAKIQSSKNIKGVYYFRSVKESFRPKIMRKINELNHEIGYHYECLALKRGNQTEAIKKFEKDLNKFRQIVSIDTICMHGSPMSKYDSKDLWKDYKYTDFDIIGEPYFDIDFNKVMYLTDTGRSWDNKKISIRDKVKTPFDTNIIHTNDIIRAVTEGNLPNQLMINFHPQRWTNNPIFWLQELIFQNLKNIVKKIIIYRSKSFDKN
jgi:hypothetical protein